MGKQNVQAKKVYFGALSIRPKIPEIPGWGTNGTDIFRYFIPKFWEYLKFRKIGITGKFRSIRPFLLGPSFSEPGNRNLTWLILKLLNIILVLYQTNDWKILLQRYCSELASQALVSSAKIQSCRTWNVSITARVNSLLVIQFESDPWTRQENRKVP